jgi:hypothetical protein
MTRDEEKALLETVAKLKAELEALKNPPKPSPTRPPHDYSAYVGGLPRSTIESMTAVVDDKLMRDIVGDHLGKPTSLPAPGPGPRPYPSDKGWIPARKLSSGPQV